MPVRTVTALAAGAGLMLVPTGLGAGSPSHATSSESEFLAQLPAPPNPPTICIVDTGVTEGPALTGEWLTRVALVGADPSDSAPSGHGTLVASIARYLLPSLRARSVRVARGDGSILWDDAARGIRVCLRDDQPGPHVITIAASGSGDLSVSPIGAAVEQARSRDVSVVVAAGNTAGSPGGLAAVPGVIPVAAVNADGGACPFSARAHGLLAAPGCPVDAVAPNGRHVGVEGTSFAVPQVAVAIAAVRAYRPELTAAQAEAVVASSGRPAGDGMTRIDVEATFRAAGLGGLPPVPASGTRARTERPGPVAIRRITRRTTSIVLHLAPVASGWRLVTRGRYIRRLPGGRLMVRRLAHARVISLALVGPRTEQTRWRRVRVPALVGRGR
jgi:hypothetical protein